MLQKSKDLMSKGHCSFLFHKCEKKMFSHGATLDLDYDYTAQSRNKLIIIVEIIEIETKVLFCLYENL